MSGRGRARDTIFRRTKHSEMPISRQVCSNEKSPPLP
jgi:hypothetical protein